MRSRYSARYGAVSFVVHRALPEHVTPSPAIDSKNGLQVGVLGNTYSYPQLPVLADAVSNAARALGVRGALTFIGHGHAARLKRDLRSGTALEIVETGHLNEADAIPFLRKQFALYLNYPFGLRNAVLRQTSFPTKLSTYALAARPLLMHAPADSTLSEVEPRGEYVLPWTSMRAEEGEEVLIRAWKIPHLHESVHSAAESVRLRYFDPQRNRRLLSNALNELVVETMTKPSSVPFER
jgi:hypothetical protein